MVPRGRISGAEGPHPQPADRQKAVSVGTAATRAKGAVYFDITMEGEKRRGHLWDHTHGKAQPRAERV